MSDPHKEKSSKNTSKNHIKEKTLGIEGFGTRLR
jgi:hypothetical protein